MRTGGSLRPCASIGRQSWRLSLAKPKKPKQRGIFCLETVWYGPEDQTSIRPLLEMLRDCFLEIPFIHRNAVTLDAFKHHIAEWLSLDATKFPILYLGYHGEDGLLQLRPPRIEGGLNEDDLIDTRLQLAEVADILHGRGGCENRLVHFASCSTLIVSDKDLASIVDYMEASAISGYGEEVDWLASSAFELNYLGSLQYGGGKTLTPNLMRNVRNGDGNHRPLFGKSGDGPFVDLSEQLGFRLQVRE